MASIFSRIINGEIPCYKIAENNYCFAFLDIRPLTKGHTLVVPKKEIDYLFDLDDNTLKELIVFSKKIAIAIKKAIPCKRVGVAVLGMEIAHAHIHLIPLQKESDINFFNPKLNLSKKEFEEIAANIKNEL